MRALVLAQGDGRRWRKPDGTYPLGTPKHLIEVDGETLLSRIVRLLSDRGVTDIVVIGPDDDRYRVTGARLATLADPHPTGTSMDKLFATRPLWALDGRSTILWGDCFYTDDAMDKITACDESEPHWFRRPAASTVTGHKWDESFALTFLPEHHDRLIEVAEHINATVPARKIHMWNHYAAYIGAPMQIGDVVDTPHQTHIDDWTDDFDSWAEWCGWMGRYMTGKVDVAICTPWFDGDCVWRTKSRDWTEKYWRDAGLRVVYGEGATRSAARNDAVRRADADVSVITDADTFVPIEQIWAAAHLAQATDRLVPAYGPHIRLDKVATQAVLDGGKIPLRRKGIENCSSGCIAVSRSLNDAVGGHDERFVGWGGEDRAFQYTCDTLAGPGERIAGPSIHLYHPPQPDAKKASVTRQANEALALRYKAAAGWEPKAGILRRLPGVEPDPDAIRSILAEPGGPLSVGVPA